MYSRTGRAGNAHREGEEAGLQSGLEPGHHCRALEGTRHSVGEGESGNGVLLVPSSSDYPLPSQRRQRFQKPAQLQVVELVGQWGYFAQSLVYIFSDGLHLRRSEDTLLLFGLKRDVLMV